ncbi:MAG: outer membrane protein assembly factor BamB family protein [Verrucomicrobiota bacterium]
MTKSELLFVGVNGSVVALEKATGQQVWSTHLKGSQFVNLILDGYQLFAHTAGELFVLNAQTGESIWHNGLKGYGYGLASLVTETCPSNPQAISAEQILEEQRRNSASSTNSPPSSSP